MTGAIAVPADEARPVACQPAQTVVRAIFKFASAGPDVPHLVIVRHADLAGETAILTHRLTLDRLAENAR